MPAETGYERRLSPKAGTPLPRADAADFGAGIGAAVEQIGETVHRTQLRAYQLDRQETAAQEGADFMRRFAELRQTMDDVSLEYRNTAQPGGAGHRDNMRNWLEAQRATLLDGISDKEVYRQATQQFDTYGARFLEGEHTWQEGQRVAKLVGDWAHGQDISNNRIQTKADPRTYEEETVLGHAALEAMPLPPDVKQKMLREGDQNRAISLLNGLNNSQPQAALAYIDAGNFNDVLTPEQLQQARNGAQIEIRRQEAAAEHAANLEQAQIRRDAALIEAKHANGKVVGPEAAALADKLEAFDPARAEKMRGIAADDKYAQIYEKQTPLQIEEATRKIAAIPENKRTPAQQSELYWLEHSGREVISRFNSDPTGAAMRNAPPALQPPPLSEGLNARAEWFRTAQPVYGPQLKIFTEAETNELRAAALQNDAGYNEVVNQLGTMPAAEARLAAQQVAPSDTAMQQLVILPQAYRKQALDGKAALRTKPAIISPADDRDKTYIDKLNVGFTRALEAVPGAARGGVIETARYLAAYEVERGKEFTPQLWAESLDKALGAIGTGSSKTGGLGSWQNNAFLVPDGMTAQAFTDRVFAFIQHHPEQGPKNPNGTMANLRLARPIAIEPGVYQFKVGNDWVLAKGRDGKIASPWQFRVGTKR